MESCIPVAMGDKHVGIPAQKEPAVRGGIVIDGVFAPEAGLRGLILVAAGVVGSSIAPLGVTYRSSCLLQIGQHVGIVALELSHTRICIKTVTWVSQFTCWSHAHCGKVRSVGKREAVIEWVCQKARNTKYFGDDIERLGENVIPEVCHIIGVYANRSSALEDRSGVSTKRNILEVNIPLPVSVKGTPTDTSRPTG